MIKKKGFLAATSLAGLLLLVFCGKQKLEWQGEIYKSEGVKIIRNPKTPMYEKDVLELEEELSLGGKEVQKQEHMFSSIKEMCVDDSGNMYILDINQKSINKFNSKGEFLGALGRTGQGPGEYGFPWDICISGNRLVVFDIIYRRIIFYSLDGEHIKHINTFKKGQLLDIEMNSNQEFLVHLLASGQKSMYELSWFDADFNKIEVIESFEREKIPLLESLSPDIHWCLTKKDEVVWGYSDRYEIKILDAHGQLTTRILRNYDPIPVNEQEYAGQIKRKFGGKSPGPRFQQKLPKNHPAFHSILSDDQGRIFIGTFDNTEDQGHNYDILDAQGKYIAQMTFPVTPFLFKKGKLYCLEQDPDGFILVKRYRVKWKHI
ncbi:MAG: 6-bladed beta-propeller [Candidatus Aminicenantes bacterium]|nr:6-bladed beta-propeller [Candidatus Aminicenantes bacterium]